MNIYLVWSFLTVVVIQCIYHIAYSIAIYRYKSGPSTASDQQEGVTILICTCNEIQNLKNNLTQILSQDYPNFEVIVVNDRSNDGTYEYLQKLQQSHENLKVVEITTTPPHVNPKKYAITLGVKSAGNERLLLTDADCWPNTPSWISTMHRGFANNKKMVLGVSLYKKNKGFLNLFIRFETWLTALQYTGRALLGRPYMGVGRNLGYTKTLFLDNKGFHGIQDVTGGDDDLFVNKYATKNNTSVIMGDSALIYSIPKTSLASYFRQKTRHLSSGKRYRFTDKIILGLFTITHVLFWVLVFLLIPYEPYLVLAGLVIRWLCLYILFHNGSKKFGEYFVPFVIPVLDFVYVIYYISAGTVAAFSKRIRWS